MPACRIIVKRKQRKQLALEGVSWMRLRRDLKQEAFERYLTKLSKMEVSVILFGSRAREEATALSDYDLLVIKGKPEMRIRPHEIEPMLDATVLETTPEELEKKAYHNSLTLAAILEGKLILDNLRINQKLQELRKKLIKQGASINSKGIHFPKTK